MRIKYIKSFDKRVEVFNHFIETKFPQLLTEQEPELYLVAGGDGAMLHAMQDTLDEGMHYLGKAMGTVNFLMNDFDDDEKIINGLINDEIKPDFYYIHTIDVYLDGFKLGEAVNDVVIGDKINDFITFTIDSNEGNFKDFEVKGCGICISTAMGSTAYNFNNGGKILPLNSCLLSITGVVTNRYMNDIVNFDDITIKANKGRVLLSNVPKANLSEDMTLTLKKGTQINIGFLDKDQFLEKRIMYAHRYRVDNKNNK